MKKIGDFFTSKIFARYCILLLPILVIITGIIIIFFYYRSITIPTQFTRGEFYEIFVKAIAAFFTFCAVVVALFKEGIISLIKYADLNIAARDTDFLFENLGKKEQSIPVGTTNPSPKAESYEMFLVVENKGNKLAEACTIQVEEISFIRSGIIRDIDIDLSKSNLLTWKSNPVKEITIYPNNKAIVSALKIIFNEGVSTPDNEQSKNAQLSIGDIISNDQHSDGVWTAVFILCSKNTKIKRYTYQITWNGEWHSRLSEMKNVLKIMEL